MTSLVALSASGLLIATIIAAVTRRTLASPRTRGALFVAAFALSFLPVAPLPLTHYARVLTGDLSMVTVILLVIFAASFISGKPLSTSLSRQLSLLAVLVVISAIILYPSALGATSFDTYGAGYYPVTIGPVLLALFIVATWRGLYLISVAVVAGFAGYTFGVLESDNLWDYLLDPVLTVFSVAHVIAHRQILGKLEVSREDLTFAVTTFGLTIIGFAIFLGRLNPHGFGYFLGAEAAFLRSCTAIALFLAFCACLGRVVRLYRARTALFSLGTTTTGIVSLIAIAALVSQNLQLPMIIGVVAMGLYLLLAIVLHRYVSSDVPGRYGIPVPTLSQVAGYLLVPCIVWLAVDYRPAEFMAFGLALVWFLVIAAPENDEIFSERERSPRGPILSA